MVTNTDNVTITKTVSGSSVVLTLDTTSMKKSFVKILQNITTPTMPQNWDSGQNDTKIIDLLRIETRYNLDGFITQGKPSGDTNADVEDRKDNLQSFFTSGGIITFNYDTETGVTGTIEKLDITKPKTDGASNDTTNTFNDGDVGYVFKMTILKGVDF